MSDPGEADRYLLDQIARGNADAWAQLVGRYTGRLLAFAGRRLPKRADPADVVQDVFLQFFQTRHSFSPDRSSLETYLFTILRRRLIDGYRGRRVAACGVGDDDAGDPAADEPTPSWHARRDEQAELLEKAVAAGLDGTIGRLRDERAFDKLRMAELLFYAQWRNHEVATAVGGTEQAVAGFKFRTLGQIRDHADAGLSPDERQAVAAFRWSDVDAADSLLTRAWERLRPTCPKRSTLGRVLLGTLDDDGWERFVDAHLRQLGCRFCLANWDDLRREQVDPTADAAAARERIVRSAVGFLPGR